MEELQASDPAQIGPYTLAARLGAGGMGQVFLGQSPGGRLVAVKVIHAELAKDEEFRSRFAREVAIARTVGGFFTVPVVDADAEAAQPWLATGYVDGPSLHEAVAEHGPMPESSLVAVAAGLAEGLSAIHAAGVVHRDLKPSNVLLASDGLRVIDFGIARAAEHTALTQTGRLIGTAGFMSPEQASGSDIGPASDVFSMGGILVFAASGENPFGRGATPELLFRVVYENPRLDLLPVQLRSLVAQCMDKDPARRPTARQFLASLPLLTRANPARSATIDWWPAAPETGAASAPPAQPEPAAPGPPLASDQPAPVRPPTPATESATMPTVMRLPGPVAPVTDDLPPPEATPSAVPPRRWSMRRRTVLATTAGALALVLGGGALAIGLTAQKYYGIGVQNADVGIVQTATYSVLGITRITRITPYQDTNLPFAQLSTGDQATIREQAEEVGDLSVSQQKVYALQVQVSQCQAAWDALEAWQKARKSGGSPGDQPPAPTSANCGPASAFGIPASALPPGTTNTTPNAAH